MRNGASAILMLCRPKLTRLLANLGAGLLELREEPLAADGGVGHTSGAPISLVVQVMVGRSQPILHRTPGIRSSAQPALQSVLPF